MDRFIVQEVTWATAKVLELTQWNTYEEAFTVQGSHARVRAKRYAQMLNTADHIEEPPEEPL